MNISDDHIKYLKSNPHYVRQYIRDLYDKMFPSAKSYIKFLRERINIFDRRTIKEFSAQMPENIKGFSYNETVRFAYDLDNNFLDKDYWEALTKKEVISYQQLTEKWLKTKTKRKRRIWNYFVLGISKNNIGARLNEETLYVIRTIETMQKEFLQLILEK